MTDHPSSESATRKIGAAVTQLLNEDPELKLMMKDLLRDAITDMRDTIRNGDAQAKASIQRLLLPHLAASATASAGRNDIAESVASIHAETLAAVLAGPDDDETPRRVIPRRDDQ